MVSHTERDGRERHRDRGNQPGRVTSHLAGPRPALPRPRHTRCARARTAPHSSCRVLIPGPDHSKLSRHAQLTPSVSLSARHPVSLGPNRPGCGADDGADGQQRPGCHGTGPGPYLLRPSLAARDPWDWPVHVVYCTVYFVLSCHVAQHCPVSPVSTTRTGHSLPLPGSP